MNLTNGLKNGNARKACNTINFCWNRYLKYLLIWMRNFRQECSWNIQSWSDFHDPCAEKSLWVASGMQVHCDKKQNVPEHNFWFLPYNLSNNSFTHRSSKGNKFTYEYLKDPYCPKYKNLKLFFRISVFLITTRTARMPLQGGVSKIEGKASILLLHHETSSSGFRQTTISYNMSRMNFKVVWNVINSDVIDSV